jgi:integrase/recombinase XerD
MTVRKAVKHYIEWKKSCGLRFDSIARFFDSFCDCLGHSELSQVNPKHVRAFLDKPSSSNATWQQNFDKLGLFFRYCRINGYIKRVPLPKRRRRSVQLFVPYIYSLSEIRRLTNRTILQKYLSGTLAGVETFRTFLLFLYGTGVFVTEALTLHVSDVDLKRLTIKVKRHEDQKVRLIPIGRDVARLLSRYLNNPNRKALHSELVFVTAEGKPVSPITLRVNFKIIRRALKIVVADTPTHQPRMHDLRHTFAVHQITRWYEQRLNVEKMIPALACYLGRVGIRSTERYLHLTPRHFRGSVSVSPRRRKNVLA